MGAMIKKKAKQKSAAKAPAKKRPAQRKQLDPAQVREEIAGMVKSGAKEITEAVMDQAMHGELAPAKYLFEVAKIYPAANDGEQATQEEDCLAKTLLARLDAAKKPAVKEDEDEAHEACEGGGDAAEHRTPEESENPNPAIP
ncbi:MAG TPA: hypothetical protein VKA07_12040 [Candidatus Sulfotelmatobacter sp.]|nr:hypothetical protein [Candidatus Sulfotelmatobacter sp.]